MTQHEKPVRRCHDCALNLGPTCAVYDDPRAMWHRRSCPGYKNEDMLKAYQERLARQRRSPRREMRQAVAKEHASTPHLQRSLPLVAR